MAYTTPINPLLIVAQNEFVSDVNLRKASVGVLEALITDRSAFGINTINNIESKRIAPAQAVYVDIPVRSAVTVADTTACAATETGDTLRSPVTTRLFNFGFAIDQRQIEGQTHGFQVEVNKRYKEGFNRAHEAISLYLESFIDTAIDAPDTTYPYASVDGIVTIPVGDWNVQQNTVQTWMANINTLLAQNDLSGVRRLVGNASLLQVLETMGFFGANNNYDLTKQFKSFDVNIDTNDGAFLEKYGTPKAFAFAPGTFAMHTWHQSADVGQNIGGVGADFIQRSFIVDDPVYKEIKWNAVQTQRCDPSAGVNGRNWVYSWNFECFVGGISTPIWDDGGTWKPLSYSLDFAV